MAETERTASMMTGYLTVLVATVIFIHTGMGVNQYKHWLLMHDEHSATMLPLDIIVECMVALGLSIFAIVFLLSRPFKKIVNVSEAKLRMMDGLTYSEDFAIFRRRRHPVPLKEA